MSDLYVGVGANETQVGRIDPDGTVRIGKSSDERRIGRVEPNGEVYVGSGMEEKRVGKLAADGTVNAGVNMNEHPAGLVGDDGSVFSGFGTDQMRVGHVRPPDRRGGAALLVLVAHGSQPANTAPVHQALKGGVVSTIVGHLAEKAARPSVWTETKKTHVVPPEVERMFDELRQHGGEFDVEDPEGGLRWQYEVGIIDTARVEEILARQRRLLDLMARGLWKP